MALFVLDLGLPSMKAYLGQVPSPIDLGGHAHFTMLPRIHAKIVYSRERTNELWMVSQVKPYLQPHLTNPRAIERNNFATKRLIVKKVAKLLRFRVCSKMNANARGFALLASQIMIILRFPLSARILRILLTRFRSRFDARL